MRAMRNLLTLLLCLLLATEAVAVDMSFGAIEYSTANASLTATLSPADGSIFCSTSGDYVCSISGTAGSHLITGTTGEVVEVRCEKTAAVSNNTTTLDIKSTTIRLNGTTDNCRTLNNTIFTHTISGVQAQDTLYSGGSMVVPKNVSPANLAGSYSSSNSGGSPYEIRLIYI